MEEQLIIRVNSKIGRSRLAVKPTDSLLSLQEKIEQVSHVPVLNQTLSLDQSGNRRLVGRPNSSLAIIGLQSGDVIWVTGEPASTGSAAAVPSAASAVPSAASAVPSAASAAPAEGPVHKSFESFLRIRRFDVGSLQGNLSYKSNFIEKGKLSKMPASVTLTRQPYRHVDHLEFMNISEIQNFVKYWQDKLHCFQQRAGWLYGYYLDDPNYDDGCRAVVEGIYEPPQTAIGDNSFALVDDDFLINADTVAAKLGLERLGLIFTGLARDFILSASETVVAAERQLQFSTDAHYTGYRLSKFVSCIVTPDSKGEPDITALMVSDQSMGMVRDRLVTLSAQNDPKHVKLRATEKNELLPTVLQSGKEVTEFDPDWFIVRVNHGVPTKPRSFFSHSHFPRENREHEKQVMASLKFYVDQVKQEATWKKYSDFHLILFIAKQLDIDTALALCDFIVQKKELSPDFQELIQALSSS